MGLQFVFSLIQCLLVPATLGLILVFKMLSNIWGKGEDIPLRHAQAAVADIVAVKFLVWMALFYLGGRYLWPTDSRKEARLLVIAMVVLTVVALGLSLTDHYLFTHTLGEFLAKHPNWGAARNEHYRELLAHSAAWSFLMPTMYLAINLSVRRRGDRRRFGAIPTDA